MSLDELKSLSAAQKPLRISGLPTQATSWGRLTGVVLAALAFTAVFTVLLVAKGFCRQSRPEGSLWQQSQPHCDSEGLKLLSTPNDL